MRQVRIEGPAAVLRGLAHRGGVHVVASSATDVGDGVWEVAAYAEPGVADELAAAGLGVRTVKEHEDVLGHFARLAQQVHPTDGYLLSADVERRLRSLAAAHPDLCRLIELPNQTHEGRPVVAVDIGQGDPAGRPACLVVGGMHAREWAPPDALVHFAESLVGAAAANGSMAHAAFVDTRAAPAITYPAWTTPAATVRATTARLRLLVLPLANPDGRDYTLVVGGGAPAAEQEHHRMWRKNRRPAPAAHSGQDCVGVDCNRNFPMAWDVDRYYSAAALPSVQISKDPCDAQIYRGPAPLSEPEARNIEWLVTTRSPVAYLDIHSFSRRILYPWGPAKDQTTDASMSYTSAAWDRNGPHHGRTLDGPYGEYLPAAELKRHQEAAAAVAAAIAAQAGSDPRAQGRSGYIPQPELALYPVPANTVDYVFVQQLQNAQAGPVALAMECGTDVGPDGTEDEGGFHPDYVTAFPKIEREVHAAVLAVCGLVGP